MRAPSALGSGQHGAEQIDLVGIVGMWPPTGPDGMVTVCELDASF
jgi:hypothetical protein